MQLGLLFLVTLCAGVAVVVFAFTGFVPNSRCLIPECENVDSASFYDRLIVPTTTDQTNKTFSHFVQLAIGGINPDAKITSLGRTCKRLIPSTSFQGKGKQRSLFCGKNRGI
jgi:hypothetical protein